jgi:hypothetical protein
VLGELVVSGSVDSVPDGSPLLDEDDGETPVLELASGAPSADERHADMHMIKPAIWPWWDCTKPKTVDGLG